MRRALPTTPASPQRLLNLSVGLLAALLGGVHWLSSVKNSITSCTRPKTSAAGSGIRMFRSFRSLASRRVTTSASRGRSAWLGFCPVRPPRKSRRPIPSSWSGRIHRKVKPYRLCMLPSCCPGRDNPPQRSADCFILPGRRQDHGGFEPLVCLGASKAKPAWWMPTCAKAGWHALSA